MEYLLIPLIVLGAAALPSAPFWVPALMGSNFIMRARGYRRIYCKRRSGDRGDGWYTWASVDPFGELTAYRHHSAKIGAMDLKEDGTGYYCGEIEWIDAP